MGDVDFYLNQVVSGLAIGAVYALFGLGITMVYKGTRVPNFAHAAIGAIGAYVFFKTWDQTSAGLQQPRLHFKIPFSDWSWNPDPPSLPLVGSLVLALAVVALLGLAIERLIMRRLAGAPTLNLIIASIGLFTLLIGLQSDVFSQEFEAVRPVFPEGVHSVGGINFSNNQLGIFAVTAALALALAAFFRYTTLGVAIRATADSREVSRLLGIEADKVAGFSWAVGSMLAAIAGILISPTAGLTSFGLAGLIVFGFTASLFGGFTSLVGTLLGGLLIGVLGNLTQAAPWPDSVETVLGGAGATAFITLLVVIGVLMLRPAFIFKGIRLDEDTGVSFATTSAGLNPEDRGRRALDRNGVLGLVLRDWQTGRVVLAVGIAAFVLAVPIFTVSYWSTVLTFGVVGSLTALSIVVITGWTGQISLAPLTFLGVGAFATAFFTSSWNLPSLVAIPLAGLVTVPFAVLVGVPALRLRGFFFALATLAFALAGERWLFTQPFFTDRADVDRWPLPLDRTQPVLYVSLAVAGLLFLALRNVRRTRVARTFFALRDSELTAQVMGIDPVRYKLLAFAVSGFVGGATGALQGLINPTIQPITFGLTLSLSAVLYAVVSGVGLLFGAVLSGFLFSVVPQLTATPTSGVDQSTVILGGLLAILTITDYPNGLASFLQRLVRPFDPGERVAWASAEEEGLAHAPAAGEEDEAGLFDRAVHEHAPEPIEPEPIELAEEAEQEVPVG
ncbi:MAG: ABC transporter permease [Actinomycetota bacterium]